MQQIRKRLTFANVMSVIAVFIALGGAAFAATQLPANSVGTAQLKKNAVTAKKIKKNAVTTAKIKNNAVNGAKVNEATLGTVPTANLANSLSPLENTHIVGAPGEPGFEGGSVNWPIVGVKFNPVGFYKDHEGIVHLQGIALVGTSGPVTPIFTLPPGFRPATGTLVITEMTDEDAAIIGGSGTTLESVDLSGKVAGLEGELANLDGITFKAES